MKDKSKVTGGTGIIVPDAAVDAAESAGHDFLRESNHSAPVRDVIRAELTAAAPYIAAQALRDAAGIIDVPNRVLLSRVAHSLRVRADRIEAGA